jgi:short chain dehydrogenase
VGVHLNGAFNVVRPAWNTMREQGYGRVVLISSNSGMFARDNGAPYAAAKAGVFGLSRALAHEGAPDGIVVNSVMPLAQTGIFKGAPLAGGPITTRVTGQLKDLYALGVPPEDVVPMTTYLASSACDSGGHLYYACGRGYAEVFVAITEGWWPTRGEEAITAEEIGEHLAEIKRADEYTVPMSIADEFGVLIEKMRKKADA